MSSTGLPSPLSSPTTSSFATDQLPPLPEIQSEQIRQRIFTHSSGLPRCHKHVFQAPEDDPPVDNEEFGHLGDQVFALAVTDAIQKRYPHLRVGPASKLRDRIKRKDMLAKICKSYGLHVRLNLPERQASQGVQAHVFKAYVGGVYRDQGADVASNWLISLLRPQVEVAYRSVREDHLLSPDTEVPQQLETPTARDSSRFSSTSSEGASPALPSYFAGGPRDHRQLPAPQASMPRQSSGQAGDGVDTRRAVTDNPRVRRRRRRRSSPRDGGSEDADGTLTQRHPPLATGLGSTDSSRKRLRAEGTNDG
ncbi:ribonuclease III domain-containing protein [Russula emetica]|nr:ribonuclease III domain-containing protein [Russula emetica]